jgi:hypothetical protein
VANGLSNAAFATGVVVAARFIQRYVVRPLFVGYLGAFVVGSCVAATAVHLRPGVDDEEAHHLLPRALHRRR